MQFWRELRRRRVYRMAGLYIVGSWLVIQVADISFPAWGVPETALRYLFIAAAACFPVALIFSWFYDITSKGIVRTDAAGESDIVDLSLKRTDYALLAALVAVGLAVLLGSAEKIQEEIKSHPAASAAIERRDNSIAVLPFTNLDLNPNTGYFSDGITEEILHRLSTLGALHVLASTSSFAFRNSEEGPAAISEKLGVRYLLHGSIRRDSDYVRVTARLVDEQGFQVWSQSFDRKMEGIFAIQTEIATKVSSEIINEIVPPETLPAGRTTSNMEAYNQYLLGKAYADARARGWRDRAIAAFRSAIELDPNFAPPHAGLAMAVAVNTGLGPRWEEARGLAEKAVELDPELAEGHAVLGLVLSVMDHHADGVSKLKHAIQLNPSLSIAYGWLDFALKGQGLIDEGDAISDRGLEIDPLNPILVTNVAMRESRLGNFDRAEQLALRLTSLPEPPNPAYSTLYFIYEDWCRFADMVRVARQYVLIRASELKVHELGLMTFGYAHLGMTEDADYWADKARAGWHTDELPIDESFDLYRKRPDQSRLKSDLLAVDELLATATGEDLAYLLSYGGLAQIHVGEVEKGINSLERGLNIYRHRTADADPLDGKDVAYFAGQWDTGLVVFAFQRLAHAYQEVGRGEEAQVLLAALNDSFWGDDPIRAVDPPVFEALALQRALLGDSDGALQALRDGVRIGWANYHEIVNDPAWAESLEAPEFQELLAEVKIEVDRQRAIVEAEDAEHDIRAQIEQLLAN